MRSLHHRPIATRRPARRVLLVVLAVVLSLSFSSTPPASAQDPSAPTTSTTVPGNAPPIPPLGSSNWSVSPTGTDPSAVSSRPYFVYDLAPGAVINDSATVWNFATTEQTFSVYAADAFNPGDGGFGLLRPIDPSTEVGSWIKLEQSSVTVPPHAGVAVPFVLTVPQNAAPGDHAGGVVTSLLSTSSGNDGKKVLVDSRVAARVYLRVPGPLTPALVIDAIDTTYDGPSSLLGGGDLSVTYTVKNVGNVRLKSQQHLVVKGPIGWTLAERSPDDLPELLPGSSATRTEHFGGVAPAVRLTTDLTITPVVPTLSPRAGQPAPAPDLNIHVESATRSSSVWAVPWKFLGLLVVAVGAAWYLRRRRRVRSGPRGSGDGDNGDGDDGDDDDDGGAGDATLAGAIAGSSAANDDG